MKIALVTDAWTPQANGVVSTLQALVRALAAEGHEVDVVHAGRFQRQMTVPGSPGVGMAFWPHRELAELLAASRPDAIHLATEGPLGWAARRYCLRRKLPFTTAFHTKFPDILHARHRLPRRLGYAVLRWFHASSQGVLVASQSVGHMLWRPRAFAVCARGPRGLTRGSFALSHRRGHALPWGLCQDPCCCVWAVWLPKKTCPPSWILTCLAARSCVVWARSLPTCRPVILRCIG